MDLEDKLKTDKPAAGIEQRLEVPKDDIDVRFRLNEKRGLFGMAWDVIKYSPVVTAQALLFPTVAATTAITAVGFAIGDYASARKDGKPYTWNRFWRSMKSGNIFGYLDFGIFSVPDYFANFIGYFKGTGLLNKIAKTAFFEATVVPPAVIAYNALEHIRDHIGYGKFLLKMATFQFRDTFKEIYEKALKGKVLSGTKSIWKIAPLLHHTQLHYMPYVWERMAMSAFVNNPIFKYILSRGAKKEAPQQAYRQPEQLAYANPA